MYGVEWDTTIACPLCIMVNFYFEVCGLSVAWV